MKIKEQKAFSLGVIEREGQKKDGTDYYIYAFHYLVQEENNSRTLYVDKKDYIKKKMFNSIASWGKGFTFSGSVDGKGNIEIDEILPETDENKDLNLF